jgi:hypothetical protein
VEVMMWSDVVSSLLWPALLLAYGALEARVR